MNSLRSEHFFARTQTLTPGAVPCFIERSKGVTNALADRIRRAVGSSAIALAGRRGQNDVRVLFL